jgi:hypothetical protein
MGSVHARGDTFLTFGLKALTETNTSRLATANQFYLCLLVKALHLWPQRCNIAKLMRCYNSSPQVQSTVTRHVTVEVPVPSTVHYPANYRIKYII